MLPSDLIGGMAATIMLISSRLFHVLASSEQGALAAGVALWFLAVPFGLTLLHPRSARAYRELWCFVNKLFFMLNAPQARLLPALPARTGRGGGLGGDARPPTASPASPAPSSSPHPSSAHIHAQKLSNTPPQPCFPTKNYEKKKMKNKRERR